jgi:hypothetical protein
MKGRAMSDPKRLNDDEVKRRLKSYEAPATTDELYGFGKMMLGSLYHHSGSRDLVQP